MSGCSDERSHAIIINLKGRQPLNLTQPRLYWQMRLKGFFLPFRRHLYTCGSSLRYGRVLPDLVREQDDIYVYGVRISLGYPLHLVQMLSAIGLHTISVTPDKDWN